MYLFGRLKRLLNVPVNRFEEALECRRYLLLFVLLLDVLEDGVATGLVDILYFFESVVIFAVGRKRLGLQLELFVLGREAVRLDVLGVLGLPEVWVSQNSKRHEVHFLRLRTPQLPDRQL